MHRAVDGGVRTGEREGGCYRIAASSSSRMPNTPYAVPRSHLLFTIARLLRICVCRPLLYSRRRPAYIKARASKVKSRDHASFSDASNHTATRIHFDVPRASVSLLSATTRSYDAGRRLVGETRASRNIRAVYRFKVFRRAESRKTRPLPPSVRRRRGESRDDDKVDCIPSPARAAIYDTICIYTVTLSTISRPLGRPLVRVSRPSYCHVPL